MMETLEAMQIGRDALWVLLKISAPVMFVSLAVGLIIALFQALTQIQEATLTFVPKIIAIFLTLMVAMPWMFEVLREFNNELAEKIVRIDGVDESRGP
jgi:flagellar biosynthetic protein FliQ